jgi:hypothetical protein
LLTVYYHPFHYLHGQSPNHSILVAYGLNKLRPELFTISDEINSVLTTDEELKIATKIENFIEAFFKTPAKIYVAVACTAWVFVSTLISDVANVSNKNAEPLAWRLVLEIINAIIMLIALVSGGLFAGHIYGYCLIVDVAWPVEKYALSVIAKQVSILLTGCPLSKAGTVLAALAM